MFSVYSFVTTSVAHVVHLDAYVVAELTLHAD